MREEKEKNKREGNMTALDEQEVGVYYYVDWVRNGKPRDKNRKIK